MPFLGGLKGFFGVLPDHVDPASQPATSALRPRPTLLGTVKMFATGEVLIFTENIVWVVMSCLLHYFRPLDLNPATSPARRSPLCWAFFLDRFLLWTAVYFVWIGFLALGAQRWCRRPLAPNKGETRRPRSPGEMLFSWAGGKVLHNMFYSLIGCAVWAVFENVAAHLWTSGVLHHIGGGVVVASDTIVVRSLLITVGCVLFALIVKDVHFFFAHRLLHTGPMFAHVHAVHHRNVSNLESFSGICMAPVEHVYYFSSSLIPLLVLPATHPLAFAWIGCHLLISPAGAHSGYEDTTMLQSDVQHLYHHKFFDVNFATTGTMFLDEWFGSAVYGADGLDGDGNPDAALEREGRRIRRALRHSHADEKSTFASEVPGHTKDGILSLYNLLTAAAFSWWVLLALNHNDMRTGATQAQKFCAAYVAGFGGVLAAIVASVCSGGGLAALAPSTLFAPFWRKRGAVETLALVAIGLLITALPVSQILYLSI